MDEGSWASLPLDLLLGIFRRLQSTAVISCSCACKPWRRAIIGNASFLRPRPDRFLPSLLLGVFHGTGDRNNRRVYLRRTPGPFQSTLPSTGTSGSDSRIQSLIPAAGGFYPEMFTDLLSSRDGFILLKGRQWTGVCLLFNPMTGACKILPDATIRTCTYVLLTGYDGLCVTRKEITDHDGLQAVRVLAVAVTDNTMCTVDNRITYQVFSFASGQGDITGAWGPVKHSVELKTAIEVLVYGPFTVVSGDAVYWLGGPKDRVPETTCAVALDVRTGRAWATELAEETQIKGANILTPTLLATSGDGRLSLVRSPFPGRTGQGQQIQVWVLMGDDDQWSLQKTINVQVHKLLPDYRPDYFKSKPVILNAFCPRSGSVIGEFAGQEIRIDLEGSWDKGPEVIRAREGFYCDKYKGWILTGSESGGFYCSNMYEMDWSTYISKMKQF